MLAAKQEYKIVTVAGNRPEIIKLSEFIRILSQKGYNHSFVYTGQHFSQNMRDVFLKDLNVEFDYDLMSSTSDVGVMRQNIYKFLVNTNPQFVIVYGDTNSTVAGALAAKDAHCDLIHIEAGLRSFDLMRAEERNRIIIDGAADYHFAPTELNRLFLKIEKPNSSPYVTGNLIVDVCRKYVKKAIELPMDHSVPKEFVLLTVHRQESVDDPVTLGQLSSLLSKLQYQVVFPIHPRTKINLSKHNILLPKNVICIDAVGYKEFLGLLSKCNIVMTDSGGVQEEAVILGRPCITLSNTTERQETLLMGANRLFFPMDGSQQKCSINDIIEEMLARKITTNPYGENVTQRAVSALDDVLDKNESPVLTQTQVHADDLKSLA
jgi:UDP-N-acetylglucosamine 2-epimerase (non-hydrolysing)